METVLTLVITTQVWENYGAHDWDGTGECPQYWKPKGGMDYSVAALSINEVANLGRSGLYDIVMRKVENIEKDDRAYREYMIDWGVYDPIEIEENFPDIVMRAGE